MRWVLKINKSNIHRLCGHCSTSHIRTFYTLKSVKCPLEYIFFNLIYVHRNVLIGLSIEMNNFSSKIFFFLMNVIMKIASSGIFRMVVYFSFSFLWSNWKSFIENRSTDGGGSNIFLFGQSRSSNKGYFRTFGVFT